MWIELSVSTTSEGADIVADLLMNMSKSGVQIIDVNDVPDDDKPRGHWELIDKKLKESYPKDVVVKAWFEDKLPDDLDDQLQDLFKLSEIELGSLLVETKGDIDGDWGKGWRRFYKPFRIGKNIVIKPSWENFEAEEDDVVIELDPGMAFGTGTHETSSLVLSLMESYQNKGDSVIDIGTGSGILAILAQKLGAYKVLGIDIDPMAVEVAKENVIINRADEQVKIIEGDLTKGVHEVFDLALANILAEVIVMLLPDLKPLVKKSGLVILSGILLEKGEMIEKALVENNYSLVEKLEKGEWLAMVVRNE